MWKISRSYEVWEVFFPEEPISDKLRGAWKCQCFPEPFSWFLHEKGLESLKTNSARCFFFIEISKERLEKSERTPPVWWRPWALAYSRDRPYNFSCLSAMSKKGRFRKHFSAFGWHLARKSLSWPTMTVSNKKQEFEQRKRIKLFDDFWVRVCRLILARGAGLVHCRLFTNSRLSRFQFWSFWSNGLDSSVFILLRFCYVVYARAKMHCYRFFSFDLRKMLCNVKADQVG